MEFNPNLLSPSESLSSPQESKLKDPLVEELSKYISVCNATPNYGSIKKLNIFLMKNEKQLHEICHSNNNVKELILNSLNITPNNNLATKEFIQLSSNITNIMQDTLAPQVSNISSLNESNKPLSEFNNNRAKETLESFFKAQSVQNEEQENEILYKQTQAARQSITFPKQLEGQYRTNWAEIEVTAEERQSYSQMLQDETSDIYQCNYFRSLSEATRTGHGLVAKELPNGKRLEVEELQAIRLFSTEFYKIINQGLRNHPTDFPKALDESGAPQKFAKEMRDIAIETSTFISSGLNKLPAYEGIIMRGTVLKIEDLENYREGNVIIEKKFSGGSTDFEVCKSFALRGTEDYPGCIPVIMCWESKHSKSIEDYSLLPAEAERLYPPGQGYQVINVGEGRDELQGFKVIYLKEYNI